MWHLCYVTSEVHVTNWKNARRSRTRSGKTADRLEHLPNRAAYSLSLECSASHGSQGALIYGCDSTQATVTNECDLCHSVSEGHRWANNLTPKWLKYHCSIILWWLSLNVSCFALRDTKAISTFNFINNKHSYYSRHRGEKDTFCADCSPSSTAFTYNNQNYAKFLKGPLPIRETRVRFLVPVGAHQFLWQSYPVLAR